MDDQTTITMLEGIHLPVDALRTALFCASDDPGRFYLNGIYLHALDDEYRIVATDGNRLVAFSYPIESERVGASVPEWIKQGVIISADGLKERLNLLDKLKIGTARVAFACDAPHVLISDGDESCTFKVRPVQGTFPDYQKIINELHSFDALESEEMPASEFDAGYLKEAGVIAKMLGSKSVRVHRVIAGEPTLVTFPDCPFAMMIQMPMRTSNRLGVGAARVLAGAVNGTIGALRAHQTRWRDKAAAVGISKTARAQAEKKVADYEKRIAAVIAAATETPALPAPDSEQDGAKPAAETTEPAPAETFAIADAVEAEPGLAAYRRGLKPQAQRRARLVFLADINAALPAGLTVSQLATGIPVDDWFAAGLTVDQAAARCLDWTVRTEPTTTTTAETGESEPVTVHGGEPEAESVQEPEAPAKPARSRGRKQPAKTDEAFERFKLLVSGIIERRKGVSLDDLVDVPLRDWFDTGLTAKKAAGRAIRFQTES